MSDGGKAFRTYLLTKSGVTNLISTRIYPDALPQNPTIPCAVYYVISDNPDHHFTGASQLTVLRIQLDCYAVTRLAANALSEAMRNAADGYRGAMGSEVAHMCHLDSKRYETDDPRDASDSYRYVVSQDWILALTETVPTL